MAFSDESVQTASPSFYRMETLMDVFRLQKKENF